MIDSFLGCLIQFKRLLVLLSAVVAKLTIFRFTICNNQNLVRGNSHRYLPKSLRYGIQMWYTEWNQTNIAQLESHSAVMGDHDIDIYDRCFVVGSDFPLCSYPRASSWVWGPRSAPTIRNGRATQLHEKSILSWSYDQTTTDRVGTCKIDNTISHAPGYIGVTVQAYLHESQPCDGRTWTGLVQSWVDEK